MVASSSGTQGGWAAGGGVEWGFLPHWSLRLQYLHLQFDNIERDFAYPGFPTAFRHTEANTGLDTVSIGVNYLFNWAPSERLPLSRRSYCRRDKSDREQTPPGLICVGPVDAPAREVACTHNGSSTPKADFRNGRDLSRPAPTSRDIFTKIFLSALQHPNRG